MYMNFSDGMKGLLFIFTASLLFSACSAPVTGGSASADDRPVVSVSLPVEEYFVDRLTGGSVAVNVLIPQSAGHSDYSPLPSQMMELSRSSVYMAIGELDFELSWKERMMSANRNMSWVDLDKGMARHDEEENMHHHCDPHYWLSPKQVDVMVSNMADALKPLTSFNVDSALLAVKDDIASLDSAFTAAAGTADVAFMIYHPALTSLASDYGMTQLAIEKDGNAPSPQAYMAQIDKAKSLAVSVVFVQKGYDMQKAQSAADMIGATVVEFSPEGRDWMLTMNTILKSLLLHD